MPSDRSRKVLATAKNYLELRGYEIIELNWRMSRYKVDIIGKKDNKIVFIEVNESPSYDHASPVNTLTQAKLTHRKNAAENWIIESKWTGQYKLSSIEIDHASLAVLSFSDQSI